MASVTGQKWPVNQAQVQLVSIAIKYQCSSRYGFLPFRGKSFVGNSSSLLQPITHACEFPVHEQIPLLLLFLITCQIK
jgi:hypothetical protein